MLRRSLNVAGRVFRPLYADASASAATAGNAEKVRLTFATPYDAIAEKEVDMVVIPASNGEMGILPNHVPVVAQLKPGVVSVHSGDEIEKYFCSGGMVVMKEDSTCSVTAAEAFPLEDLDPAAVEKGIEKFQAEFDRAPEGEEKTIAQLGLEMHQTMKQALEA